MALVEPQPCSYSNLLLRLLEDRQPHNRTELYAATAGNPSSALSRLRDKGYNVQVRFEGFVTWYQLFDATQERPQRQTVKIRLKELLQSGQKFTMQDMARQLSCAKVSIHKATQELRDEGFDVTIERVLHPCGKGLGAWFSHREIEQIQQTRYQLSYAEIQRRERMHLQALADALAMTVQELRDLARTRDALRSVALAAKESAA